MCDRIDLELRVYLTGRPDGTIEWQLVRVLEDGQVEWRDGDVSSWRMGGPIVPARLTSAAILNLRGLCYTIRA